MFRCIVVKCFCSLFLLHNVVSMFRGIVVQCFCSFVFLYNVIPMFPFIVGKCFIRFFVVQCYFNVSLYRCQMFFFVF